MVYLFLLRLARAIPHGRALDLEWREAAHADLPRIIEDTADYNANAATELPVEIEEKVERRESGRRCMGLSQCRARWRSHTESVAPTRHPRLIGRGSSESRSRAACALPQGSHPAAAHLREQGRPLTAVSDTFGVPATNRARAEIEQAPYLATVEIARVLTSERRRVLAGSLHVRALG